MRLIDADKFISTLKESKECGVDSIATGEIIELINDEPTVEPKKGHWERTDKYTGFAYMSYMKCSECGASMPNIYADDFNFCPNCGAYMRGDNK